MDNFKKRYARLKNQKSENFTEDLNKWKKYTVFMNQKIQYH